MKRLIDYFDYQEFLRDTRARPVEESQDSIRLLTKTSIRNHVCRCV